MTIIGFTGHREIGGYKVPNPAYDSVFQDVENILVDLKPEKTISGMAIGFDMLAAEVSIKLGIPFIAAVPFVGQEKIWPAVAQKRYNELLSKATEVVIVSKGGYVINKMQIRNEWIVDHSDVMLEYWNGSPGGTKNCREYAKSKGKQIVSIDPGKLISLQK